MKSDYQRQVDGYLEMTCIKSQLGRRNKPGINWNCLLRTGMNGGSLSVTLLQEKQGWEERGYPNSQRIYTIIIKCCLTLKVDCNEPPTRCVTPSRCTHTGFLYWVSWCCLPLACFLSSSLTEQIIPLRRQYRSFHWEDSTGNSTVETVHIISQGNNTDHSTEIDYSTEERIQDYSTKETVQTNLLMRQYR